MFFFDRGRLVKEYMGMGSSDADGGVETRGAGTYCANSHSIQKVGVKI